MSFKDEVFDFSENKGLNLICGKNLDIPGSKNGVSKTTVLNALVYGLFGEITTKVNNKNLHNKYIRGKEMRIVVWFNINDEEVYKVASGLDKYGLSYCNLYQVKDKEEIDITKSSIAETRKFLENEILHFDKSIFLRSILLTSDQNYNFFLLDKAAKTKFIEKLFNITVFGNMYKLIHSDSLQLEKQIYSKQNELLVLNKKLDEYKECIESFVKSQSEEIKSIENSLEIEKEKYNQLTSSVSNINENEISTLEEKVKKIDSNIKKLKSALDTLVKKHTKLDSKIYKAKTKIDCNESLIHKYDTVLDKLCDECKTKISEMYKVNQLLEEISRFKKEIESDENELVNIAQKQNLINQKIEEQENIEEKLSESLTKLTNDYHQKASELATIKSTIGFYSDKLNNLQTSKNPYLELKEKTEVEYKELNENLDKLNLDYTYLEFAANIVSQDTLKKFVIKDIIHVLNNRIKTYLYKVGAKFTCEFDENMVYHFITEGGETEYGAFSAGERMRLMIAASFAFREFMAIRNNLLSNIILLDEFIDGNIDQVAIDGIIDIMKEFIQTYGQNVYIISHRKELQNDIFDNIIQVVKENNISKITYVS
jgi:DNA repair exonuclease SbcCD ATPase subunit